MGNSGSDRKAQTGALPAAPRGAGPDEKKPFTGKGSVWLEVEAVTSKPVSVRGLSTGKFAGTLRGIRAQGRGLAPSPADAATGYARLGDFPETRNREISGNMRVGREDRRLGSRDLSNPVNR
jgi:hypothetical protein